MQINVPKAARSVNKLAFLAETNDMSENQYIRGVAKRNCGMAGLNLVENIPLSEAIDRQNKIII
jgi:hypothetical protein